MSAGRKEKPMGLSHKAFWALFFFLGSLVLAFILVPLFKLVFLSDKQALWRTLLDPDTARSIWLTIYSALIAVAIGFVLGVPLAYVLARYDFPGKSVIEGLIDLPVVVPHSAAGIALLFVFGSNFSLLERPFGRSGSSSSTRWPGS